MYFVYPSTDALVDISTDTSIECWLVDISTNTRPVCRLTYQPTLDRHIDRDMSVDIPTDMSIEISTECRSIYLLTIGRSLGQYSDRQSADMLIIDCLWNIGRLSVVYQLNVMYYNSSNTFACTRLV